MRAISTLLKRCHPFRICRFNRRSPGGHLKMADPGNYTTRASVQESQHDSTSTILACALSLKLLLNRGLRK